MKNAPSLCELGWQRPLAQANEVQLSALTWHAPPLLFVRRAQAPSTQMRVLQTESVPAGSGISVQPEPLLAKTDVQEPRPSQR